MLTQSRKSVNSITEDNKASDFKIFYWVTLKHGVPHWCTYWCTPKKIQTRTNDHKRIKEQDLRLEKEEAIINQCTKKLQTLTDES